MSGKRKLFLLAVVVIVLVVLASLASRLFLRAASSGDGAVVLTGDYRLDAAAPESIFVIADTAELTADSRVQSDAALVGRSLVTLAGQVDGDLTVMGSDVIMSPSARVTGEVAIIGTRVTLAGQLEGEVFIIADTLNVLPQTVLGQTVTACATTITDERTASPSVLQCSEEDRAALASLRDGSFFTEAVRTARFSTGELVFSLLTTLVLAAFSGLIVSIFPRSFSYMTEAVYTLPRRMAGVGLLTFLLIPAVAALLVLTLALLPPLGLLLLLAVALLGLAFLILLAAGWMTMSLIVGEALLIRLNQRSSPPLMTIIVGSIILFGLSTLISFLPYGPLVTLGFGFLLGSVGLGAALVTRLGTRPPTRRYFVQA